ncbi:hypothetical protein MKW98_018848, partial [Papaver atlanticum]
MHSRGLSPDNFTFPFVLKSCDEFSFTHIGKCVHGKSFKMGFEFDLHVGTLLI